MRRLGILITIFLFALSTPLSAEGRGFNYEEFIDNYFSAWLNVQKPKAQTDDLERYLAFFTDDLGYQHLPYSNDDSRLPGGKKAMREGMTYYLGKHTEYTATLENHRYGHNVIVLEYTSNSKGIHPDSGELTINESKVLEVLELDNGKISVLRHYSE